MRGLLLAGLIGLRAAIALAAVTDPPSGAERRIVNFTLHFAGESAGCPPRLSFEHREASPARLQAGFAAAVREKRGCEASDLAHELSRRPAMAADALRWSARAVEQMLAAKDYVGAIEEARSDLKELPDTGDPGSVELLRFRILQTENSIIENLGHVHDPTAIRLGLDFKPGPSGTERYLLYREFYADFPKSPHLAEVRRFEASALNHLVDYELDVADQYEKRMEFNAGLAHLGELFSFTPVIASNRFTEVAFKAIRLKLVFAREEAHERLLFSHWSDQRVQILNMVDPCAPLDRHAIANDLVSQARMMYSIVKKEAAPDAWMQKLDALMKENASLRF